MIILLLLSKGLSSNTNLTGNGVEIDQSLQTYDLGTEVVNMKYLTYSDFGDTYPIKTPWVQIHLNQGENTIKIMRHVGYGLSLHTSV